MSYVMIARPRRFMRAGELKKLLDAVPADWPIIIDGLGREAYIIEIGQTGEPGLENLVFEIHTPDYD